MTPERVLIFMCGLALGVWFGPWIFYEIDDWLYDRKIARRLR